MRDWCHRPFGRSRRRIECEALARITGLPSSLRQHEASVGEAFQSIGRRLQQQHELTTELVRCSERFERFTDDEGEGNPIHRTIVATNEALQLLDTFGTRTGELLAELEARLGEIARLRQSSAQLQRAAAPLRIIEILFRIETAALPADVQAAFAALTQDISELETRVRETFSRQVEALDATHATITAIAEQLGRQRQEHVRVAAAQRRATKSTIEAIHPDLARLRAQHADAVRLTSQLEHETNAIVVGLQFQDITHQKIDHIIGALEGLASSAHDQGGRSRCAVIEMIGRLQGRQVAGVAGDIEDATRSVQAGLRRIGEGLGALEANASNACTDDAAARITSSTETLLKLISQLEVPLREAAGAASRTAAELQSVSGIALNLGTTIRELTWGIRIVALNAQVQAARVENCDGLEVLARHTYAVSDETNQAAASIGSDLDELAVGVQRLGDRTSALATETSTASGRLTGSLAEAAATLRDESTAVVTAVEQVLPLARSARQHASELLAFSTEEIPEPSPLSEAQRVLEDVADRCARSMDTLDEEAQRELLQLRHSYTMEAERVIHAGIAAPARNHVADTPPAAEPVLAGGNVELF